MADDFNMILLPIDKTNKLNKRKDHYQLQQILDFFNLNDPFRDTHPNAVIYTYTRPNTASDVQQESTNNKNIIFSSIEENTNSSLPPYQNLDSNDDLTTLDSNDDISIPETLQTSPLTPNNDPPVQDLTRLFQTKTGKNKQKNKDSKSLKNKHPKTPKKRNNTNHHAKILYLKALQPNHHMHHHYNRLSDG